MPARLTCVVANNESHTLTLIAMVVTDIALLLIVLVGLLHFRRHGGGTFGIAQLLWKQVWWRFSLALIFQLIICLPIERESVGSCLPPQLEFRQ